MMQEFEKFKKNIDPNINNEILEKYPKNEIFSKIASYISTE